MVHSWFSYSTSHCGNQKYPNFITCHRMAIIKSNILLGRPWIWEMQYVPYTYHDCLKYIHEGKVHCVLRCEYPYSHCNIIDISIRITLPSPNLSTIPLSPKKISHVEFQIPSIKVEKHKLESTHLVLEEEINTNDHSRRSS